MVEEGILGAVSGPDVYQRMYFHAGFNGGGDTTATTSTGSTVMALADWGNDVSYIEWTANRPAETITTMATTSSAMDAIVGLTAGDSREIIFYSATTTAATAITFAAGTGVDLQEDEGETVVVNGLEYARLTFIRKANTDVALIVEPFQVGD